MSSPAIISSGWNNGINPSCYQLFTSRITVIGFIGDQSLRRTNELGFVELSQRCWQQFHFRRGRRVQVNSERSTRAICQYHKLCSLAALGLADSCSPFFARMKVPSTKHSFQLIIPSSSSWLKNARHKSSSVSSCAHCVKRRWTVLGLPYRSGNSLQGAPVHKIHKMPSKH